MHTTFVDYALGESTYDATTNPYPRQAQTFTQNLWPLPGGLHPRRSGALPGLALRPVQRCLHGLRSAPARGERSVRPLGASASAQTCRTHGLARITGDL